MTPQDWHWCGAAIGGGLCGFSGLLSFWLALKLIKKGPVGPLAAMVLGLVLRTSIGLGGSALAFTLLKGWTAESNDKIAFWVWVLAAYLVSLIVEMVLLVRCLPPLKLAPSAEPTGATETGKG